MSLWRQRIFLTSGLSIFDLQSFILVKDDDNVVDRAASRWHLETAVLVECTAIFVF